jgi:peptidoglycan/xylan/chitin deacetylase (PgdA/CDA1 family)
MVSRAACPVLLYHSIAPKVDAWLEQGLDNVPPDFLYRQLSSLKRRFRVVDLEELASMKNRSGHAAVTFDDAYRNVTEWALPVLESLGVPATIFVNTSTLEGKVFWRDKIRYVINKGLSEDFLSYARGIRRVEGVPFYKYTKMPCNNSKALDQELDGFFRERGIELEVGNLCVSSPSDLLNHPLLRYGNHGHSHYVMSSISEAEQREEIFKAKGILAGIDVRKSRLFSLPFGGREDYDDSTLSLLAEAGYEGMLLSRGALTPATAPSGFLLLERFMPLRNHLDTFMKKTYFRGKLASAR